MKTQFIIFLFFLIMSANINGQETNYGEVELMNWELDKILLYEEPNGKVWGEITLQHYYPNKKKQYYITQNGDFLSRSAVNYLIILVADNLDFKPYRLVDGESSQKIWMTNHVKNGGTVRWHGGYELRMRLVTPFAEWSEVIIHEPTGKTAYIRTTTDFVKFRPIYER